MKLSFEDKKEMIELRKRGWTWKQLSQKFQVNQRGLKYLWRLVELHGIDYLRKGKKTYYPPELKQKLIDKVLMDGASSYQLSLEYGLPNSGLLCNWIAIYKKNGYTIVEKTKGRPPKMGRKSKKKPEEMTKLELLERENEYLKAELAYLKKLRELRLQRESKTK